MSVAYCYRSGEIRVGRQCPKGALPLAYGRPKALRTALEGAARLAYDNATWLVPGVPEATNDTRALGAAIRFAARLKKSVAARQEAA